MLLILLTDPKVATVGKIYSTLVGSFKVNAIVWPYRILAEII